MDMRHPPYILRKFFLSVIKESGNVFINLINFSNSLQQKIGKKKKKKKKNLA
jgi:hypothetical protein